MMPIIQAYNNKLKYQSLQNVLSYLHSTMTMLILSTLTSSFILYYVSIHAAKKSFTSLQGRQ
jgi:hypothetical protein